VSETSAKSKTRAKVVGGDFVFLEFSRLTSDSLGLLVASSLTTVTLVWHFNTTHTFQVTLLFSSTLVAL
jgi:hypothetical protein